ncbi:GNAT family N-acetyltransferase [Streptomyces sp. NPDC049879]|uniref:GNAT family N-acetyltransferase n=1 Tax=Streptomyces sp. NPDC049879 TaxID=3365598 RepID=UPI003788D2F6
MDESEHGVPTVRRAGVADAAALVAVDALAAAGDEGRRASIARWCGGNAVVLLAEDPTGPLGYAVLEYTFFEQGFLTLLTVAPTARRRGIGRRLLAAVEAECATPKLFTSTNVSHHPMQRLLQGAGWEPAGLLHGLDEGDPELFFRRARRTGHVLH